MSKDSLRMLMNSAGSIAISALDHRGLLKKMLHPENPDATLDEEIAVWKRMMVELYKNEVSGLLIDPIYGRTLIDKTAKCGWIFSMEQTGYEGEDMARVTTLIPDWSVSEAKKLGACAVKLLLYYDPDNQELALKQKEVARKLANECEKEEMVYLLEPLAYVPSKDPRLVERIVDDLKDLKVDIFKLQYPGDLESCKRISRLLSVPWVLLSAGSPYETYVNQLQIACQGGASGMAVGRAAWQEFGKYQGKDRERFMRETALPRIRELVGVVEKSSESKVWNR